VRKVSGRARELLKVNQSTVKRERAAPRRLERESEAE